MNNIEILNDICKIQESSAKNYFETYFVPYRMSNRGNYDGLITGYFEPQLHGSRKPTRRFWVPVSYTHLTLPTILLV